MTTLRGQSVLVTGAGGFIGSHLAERLVREGARVRAMVHYNGAGRRGWLDESPLADDMQILQGDITDPEQLAPMIRGVDVVFHLAALIGIPYSYAAPRSYLRTNTEGTMNVLEAARAAGTPRVIHTSTSEVYGTARRAPIDEDHPLVAQSPYAASKSAADQLALAYHRSFALPVLTVRPFNTFGPRQSRRAVIPTIIDQCLHPTARPARIELGALHPTRDLNFVDNTVDGFIAAALAPNHALGHAFNLGTGREISIADLANLIAQRCGVEPDIVSTDERARPPTSEVERLIADASNASNALGWTPKVALEEGLDRTIAWFKDRGHADDAPFVASHNIAASNIATSNIAATPSPKARRGTYAV